MRTICLGAFVLLAADMSAADDCLRPWPFTPQAPTTVCCIKPWIIPDKWTELSEPPNDVFDPGVDVYECGFTFDDIGAPIHFIPSEGPNPSVRFGQYEALDFGNGGECYRQTIVFAHCDKNCCNDTWFTQGDTLLLDTRRGNLIGPTKRGIKELIDLDPGAYWDPATQMIQGSGYPGYGPRLVQVATYNPMHGFPDSRHAVLNKVVIVFSEKYDDHGAFYGRYMGEVPDDPPWPWPDSLESLPDLPVSESKVTLSGVEEPTIQGDLTHDGVVDNRDVSLLTDYLTGRKAMPADKSSVDLTGDGMVDVKDLAELVGRVK